MGLALDLTAKVRTTPLSEDTFFPPMLAQVRLACETFACVRLLALCGVDLIPPLSGSNRTSTG